ncbi:WD40-repeat-containing domain protein, partial [Cubamyces lactineus]
HVGGVVAVAFSPEGNYIATAGIDRKVCIWAITEEDPLHILDGRSTTLSLAWEPSPHEAVLLIGMQDGTVSLDELMQGRLRAQALPGHHAPVECLAISSSELRLASGAHHELFVWKNVSDHWTPIFDLGAPPLTSHTEHRQVVVTSVHWTTTKTHGRVLLVTYMHHGVMIYDSEHWTRLRVIPMQGCIVSASIGGESNQLAVSNLVSGFDVYSLETGASLGSLRNPTGTGLRAVPVLFAHNGNAIVGGSTTGIVRIW